MGKQWKQWLTILGGSKITADGDCSHEINRCLLLGRKIMTSLDCILKHQFFMLNFLYSPTLESPLDCKEIQPVHPKGNQSWMFIGRIDVEVEIPIFRPSDMKSWLIWKDPDVGKDWRQEEKGMTEYEIGWHHRLNGHEFGYTPELVMDREACRAAVHGVAKSRREWVTELNWKIYIYI